MRHVALLLQLLTWVTVFPSSVTVQAVSLPQSDLFKSTWYDWGFYGIYPRQWYKSFPFGAPLLNFLRWDARCDDGYTFMSPRGKFVRKPGPVIMDAQGELVWMEEKFGQAMDFKMQTYKGEQYLTFWNGKDSGTYGRGVYYMLNSSYDVYKTLTPSGELEGDLHELKFTDNDTALMTIYEPSMMDLSPLGGPIDGWVYDSIFQEVDIETGALIFEWRASQHYQVNETFRRLEREGRTRERAMDFFHINSIDKDREGNYYISSRYMHTVTCISPTGQVLWVLGGKRNMFLDLSDGAATNFTWQHHVKYHENNTLTVFDNGNFAKHYFTAEHSRGLRLSLDPKNMTVTLLQEYLPANHLTTPSQGSVQILENGNVLVGWGYSAAYSEYTLDGELLCDVHIGPSHFFKYGWVKSYRAFRSHDWVGRPGTPPSLHYRAQDGRLYVSWNGATEVTQWILQGAKEPDADDNEFINIVGVPKRTFETGIEITGDMADYLKVVGIDAAGRVLGSTEVVGRRTGNAGWDRRELLIVIFISCLLAYGVWRFRHSIPGIHKAYGVLGRLRNNGGDDTTEAKEHELMPLYAD